MNVEQLEQLKQEFQNERKEQITRAKEFQKETLQRRKAMQLKAQLEAAKEEKRIKEALAERRAQHVEATMRFQKGIKHFKYNKEKISIEEVLKKINQRSRKNSIDDKVIIYNSELASYLNSSGHTNQLKKSSSFDSLNIFNTSSSSMMNTNEMNRKLNSNENFRFNPKVQQTEYKPLSNIHANQIKSKQELINENQKAIQEINREAFKEFQIKISNENSSFRPLQTQPQQDQLQQQQQMFQQIHYQQVKPQIVQQQQLVNQHHNSDFDVLNSNLANNLKQKAIHFKSNSEIGLINNTKNSNLNTKNTNINPTGEDEDCGDDDSMDTDSLLNEGIDLNQKSSVKTTANKIDGEDDDEDDNGKVLRKTHFYTDPFAYLSNMTFPLNDRLNSTLDLKKLNLNSTPSSPVITRAQSKEKIVKSILKRSTSYDNNLNIMNKNSLTKDLKIDTRHDKIKDSLELTNTRMNRNDSASSDQIQKKSVRFAAVNSNQLGANQTQKQLNFEIAPIVMNHHQHQQQPQPTSQPIKNATNVNEQKQISQAEPQPAPNSNETTSRSRISSTDSIRRPVIKPRNTSHLQQKQAANKKPDVSTHQTEEPLNNTNNTINNGIDSSRSNMNSNRENTKPPIHPNTTATTLNQLLLAGGQNGSYLLLSQKRKELVQKKTNEQGLNSPKTIVMNSPSSPCSNMSQTTNSNRISETPLNTAYNNNSFNNNNNSNGSFRMPFSQHILPISSPTSTANKLSTPNQPMRNQFENDIQQGKTSTPTSEIIMNRKLNTDQFNFTRIPLSPKSNLTRNVNMQQTGPLADHLVQKRPFSAIISTNNINSYIGKPPLPSATNTQLLVNPLTNEHQAYQDSSITNKQNIKYGYMNNQQYFQNATGGTIYPGPRVLSADSINSKYTNSPLVQLEIKYPLYSNFQTQTQYINISKPMRAPTQQHHQQANDSQEVGESLRAFLKAEEMSTKGCTESQIINTVQDMNKRVPLRTNPINLSLEEENVKNSIMRLNERLKMFSNTNGAMGATNNNLNNLMKANEYENMNKYRSTKPISAATLKIQR